MNLFEKTQEMQNTRKAKAKTQEKRKQSVKKLRIINHNTARHHFCNKFIFFPIANPSQLIN